MKKVLIVTHVSGFVPQFEMNNVKTLQSMGYEVHYASNFSNPSYGYDNERLKGTGVVCHQIDFERSPFHPNNVKAYKQLKQLMTEMKFDLAHCHTPVGGVLTRLAAYRTKTKPVLYTAHGFHFFKGAPLKNWLFYYPVECLLSYLTDYLICINDEDYFRAKKWFHAKHYVKIPGVGIHADVIDQTKVNCADKRKSLQIPEDAFVFLSVGEINKNKNQELMLHAMGILKRTQTNDNVYYALCGKGPEEQRLHRISCELGIQDCIVFLGYRKDVYELYKSADAFVFPSQREGMPVALMEAMASELPVICSDIRGNRDLIDDGKGGFLIKSFNKAQYCEAMVQLIQNKPMRKAMGNHNRKKIEQFTCKRVMEIMERVYREALDYKEE